MKQEYDMLIHNDTWSLISQSLDDNVINCKWIFCIKHHANGSIKHLKVSLVANEMQQVEGEDYNATLVQLLKRYLFALSSQWLSLKDGDFIK